jgi:hypothetical protein
MQTHCNLQLQEILMSYPWTHFLQLHCNDYSSMRITKLCNQLINVISSFVQKV